MSTDFQAAPSPSATRTVRVRVPGDGELDAHVVLPPASSGPGVVVLHEIFGLSSYIRDVADRLARLGYVALCPDLYWRIEPGAAMPPDEAGLRRALELFEHLDAEHAVGDAVAALAAVRALPEVTGPVAVLGFCFGGTLAFRVAAEADPDAAVAYYGSGIAGSLQLADRIECPILCHFGGQDPYIPRCDVDRVRALAARRAGMECHVQEDAGHAFDTHGSTMFYRPAAALRAWRITEEFLARTLSKE